jgi:hypothetical protein
MVTAAMTLAVWLLRRGVRRWPAGIRADLEREWVAEVHTVARDERMSGPRRGWLMLAFAISLALARPGGRSVYAPLGWRKIAAVLGAVLGYLMVLSLVQRGWYGVFDTMAEGERPIIDDTGLPARLVVGAAALVPIVVATAAGWLLGRTRARSGRVVRPVSLGLCIVAVVAAWTGAGFVVGQFSGAYDVLPLVPVPGQMSYGFGNQPYGMVTSWIVWLICFVALAGAVRWAADRRRAAWRIAAGAAIATAVAGVAVTGATFVQFGPSTAPRTELWKWFVQWLVPPDPFQPAVDEGADSFHSARLVQFLVSSYPHALLAVAAFGVAFLLSHTRRSRRTVEDAEDTVTGVLQP